MKRRTRSRKGDAFIIQEFFVWLVLVLVAILLFGLYWSLAESFTNGMTGEETFTNDVLARSGGDALRVYLDTRLDEPFEKYVPQLISDALAEHDTSLEAPSINASFTEVIPRIMADKECRDSFFGTNVAYMSGTKADTKLPKESWHTYNSAWVKAPAYPTTECEAFVLRTIVFFRTVCINDFYTLKVESEQGSFNLGRGPVPNGEEISTTYPVLEASQSFIADGESYTVSLHCSTWEVMDS